jgi:hypothetical protein
LSGIAEYDAESWATGIIYVYLIVDENSRWEYKLNSGGGVSIQLVT